MLNIRNSKEILWSRLNDLNLGSNGSAASTYNFTFSSSSSGPKLGNLWTSLPYFKILPS